MATVLELREKRAAAWDKAKAFLDSKRGEAGTLSAEDSAVYDKMEADVMNLGKEINRLEKQTAIDDEMDKATSNPLKNNPETKENDGENKDGRGRASNVYKKAFWNVMRGLPAVFNDLSVGTDTKGGYTVPDEFEAVLIEALQDENIMRQVANVIQTSSGDTKIPVVATKGTAFWVDEAATIPTSDDTFGQVTLSAYKLATRIKVSEELLNDSVFNLEQYIAREFARRIGVKEEEAFIGGDGVGKPLGLLAAAGGAQADVVAAKPNAISLDDVLDLFYGLRTPYRRNAVFIMNDATVKAVRKLKDSTGQYLWAPSIKDATPDTILNRPLYTSIFMPSVAPEAKVMLFGDFSYYWIADRQGRQFKRLNELYAETGQVGFIGTQRVDGRLILPEAVKALVMAEAA